MHCFVKVNKGAMLSGEHAYMYVGITYLSVMYSAKLKL